MRKRDSQRGQVLPLVGIAMVLLLGAAGFAVDVGYHQYRQRLQQTATDSAAVAAAQELNSGNFVAAGRRDAASNGFTDGTVNGTCAATATCVAVTPPRAPDLYAGAQGAVEVMITSPNATFFEKAFGITNVSITTKAVGILIDENSNTCLVTLTGGANLNNGAVNAPNCGLAFNGPTNFHGATVDAAAIDCAASCSNGTFTQASPTTTAPASDPCPTIAYCSYMSDHPPTCTSQPAVPKPKSGPVVLQPGCYGGGTTITNSDVQFTCGLYVIQGSFSIFPNGKAKNAPPNNVSQACSPPGGVTLYVDTGGSLNLRDVTVNLSAPSTGDYTQYSSGEQNVLVYQVPGNQSTVNFQSVQCTTCAINLTGMLYAPSANLNYNASSGSSSGDGVLIITGTANLNGGFSGLFSAPGSGTIVTKTAVLGE